MLAESAGGCVERVVFCIDSADADASHAHGLHRCQRPHRRTKRRYTTLVRTSPGNLLSDKVTVAVVGPVVDLIHASRGVPVTARGDVRRQAARLRHGVVRPRRRRRAPRRYCHRLGVPTFLLLNVACTPLLSIVPSHRDDAIPTRRREVTVAAVVAVVHLAVGDRAANRQVLRRDVRRQAAGCDTV